MSTVKTIRVIGKELCLVGVTGPAAVEKQLCNRCKGQDGVFIHNNEVTSCILRQDLASVVFMQIWALQNSLNVYGHVLEEPLRGECFCNYNESEDESRSTSPERSKSSFTVSQLVVTLENHDSSD